MSDTNRMEERISEPGYLMEYRDARERQRLISQEPITQFLGEGPHSCEAFCAKWYYANLLAWSVKSIFNCLAWKTVSVYCYDDNVPAYRDIQIDCGKSESCLVNGQALLEHGDDRFVVAIHGSDVQIQAGEKLEDKVKQLIKDISDFMRENNFYKMKRVGFDGRISFLNVGQKDWNSVILDPDIKEGIRLNTVGFLKNIDRIQEYGIPTKRGIILAGDPGVGKTIVCKALMAEAEGVTCISTSAYALANEGYISNLYELAQDLAPSMVFIEDIDFFGQERLEFYNGNPPFLALLSEMDGITEKTSIVTVATSNCFEKLDKALSERPSRFDRVFQIPRPKYSLRVEILRNLARSIPLSEDNIEYIAKKTEGKTPAQVQEVPFSLVNSQLDRQGKVTEFSRENIDVVVAQMKHTKSGGGIGFQNRNGI